MELLRVWRAHLLGGAVAAVVAPAAILIAALAVGVGGGGIQGLGSLGQALTGPPLPEVEPDAPGTRREQDPRRLLERSLRPGSSRLRLVTPGPAGEQRRDEGRKRRRRDRRDRDGRRDGRRPRPGEPGAPPGGQPPPPPPPQEPSQIRQLGEQIKQVTNQIPIAGEPAGQVVDVIVETVESLPPPPILGVSSSGQTATAAP